MNIGPEKAILVKEVDLEVKEKEEGIDVEVLKGIVKLLLSYFIFVIIYKDLSLKD